jgi:tetratricopeptide (TPR) repeat protein
MSDSVFRALLTVLTAAWCGSALASTEDPSGPKETTSKEQRARELDAQGARLYDLAEYDRAIEAFKEAYLLTENPSLLYNIAQTYRRKGDCEHAALFYRNYLRSRPKAADREKIEGRIAEMDACSKPLAEDLPGIEEPAAPPVPAVVSTPEPPSESGAPAWISWTTGGAGLVAVGSGAILLATVARGLDSCTPRCTDDRISALRLRAGVGYGLIGVGSAAAIVATAIAVVAGAHF